MSLILGGFIFIFIILLFYIQWGMMRPLRDDFKKNEVEIQRLKKEQSSQEALLNDIQVYREGLYGLQLVLEARKNVIRGDDPENPYLVFDYSQVLNSLRKLLPNDARVTAFQVNQKGLITLPIESVDYASLGRVLKYFKSSTSKEDGMDEGLKRFKSITIPTGAERRVEQSDSNGIKRIENLYSFVIQAELNPNFWEKNSLYNDVPEGAYYLEHLKKLSHLGMIGGYEDGSFKPDQAITHQELYHLIRFELESQNVLDDEVSLKRLQGDQWQQAYQGLLKKWGVEAVPKMDEKIGRLDLLRVLSKIYRIQMNEEDSAEFIQLPFTDVNKDTSEIKLIKTVYQKGLLDHIKKQFEAKKPVTRGEVVYWMGVLKFD